MFPRTLDYASWMNRFGVERRRRLLAVDRGCSSEPSLTFTSIVMTSLLLDGRSNDSSSSSACVSAMDIECCTTTGTGVALVVAGDSDVLGCRTGLVGRLELAFFIYLEIGMILTVT